MTLVPVLVSWLMPPSGWLPDSSWQVVLLLLGGQFQEEAALGIFAVLCSPIFILDPAPPCLETEPALLASSLTTRDGLDRELSGMDAFGVLQSTFFSAPREKFSGNLSWSEAQ